VHAGGGGVSRAVHVRETALVAQQLGLVVFMSGRDVDFNPYAYTDKKGFLKAGRLANAVDERLTRAIGIGPVLKRLTPRYVVPCAIRTTTGTPTGDAQGPAATGCDVGTKAEANEDESIL